MAIVQTACALLGKAYPDKLVFSLEDFCCKNTRVKETVSGSCSLPTSLEAALVVQNIEGNFRPPPESYYQPGTTLSLSLVFESAESAIIQRGFSNWHLPCVSAQCLSCHFLYHVDKADWDSLHNLTGTPAMKWLLSNTSIFCLVLGKVYVQVCGPICRINLDSFSRPTFVRQNSGPLRVATTGTKSLASKRKASSGSGSVFLGPAIKRIRIQNKSDDKKLDLHSQAKKDEPEGSAPVATTTLPRCSLELVSLASGSVCHLPPASKIRLISLSQEVLKATPVKRVPSEIAGDVKGPPLSRKKRRKTKSATPRLLPDHRRAFNGSLVITHDDVLYSHSGWTHFQLQHPLQRNCSTDLIRSIAETDVGSDVDTFDDSQLELFKVLIQQFHKAHRAFKYERLLKVTTGANEVSHQRKPICNGRVVLFLKKTINLVPEQLLGGSENVQIFFRNVKRFVLAGRGRSFTLGDLMQNMQTSRCQWLHAFRSLAVQTCLLAKLIVWLFNDFIKPLLRQHFYITETTYGRNGLIFFTKSDWQSIRARALRQLCPTKQNESQEGPVLQRIDPREPLESLINARLRFVPKRQGLRPIMNAVFSSRVNKKLVNNALLLLRTLYQRLPEYVDGKSAADFRNRWAHFLQRRASGPVYYVRVDVADAYGSILHSKLETILTKYLSLLPPTTRAKTVCFVDPWGKRSRNFRLLPALKDMRKFLDSLPRGGIVFNQNINETLDVGQIVGFLKSCITNVAVTHNNDLFQLCQGVPQGGRLSASLCHLYYGAMVQEHLGSFQSDPNDLLLRVVDDFLYITPSYQRAAFFFDEMQTGFPDFNCSVNQVKTMTNLPSRIPHTTEEANPESPEKRSPSHLKTKWASFCGLQFNSSTLELRGDYTNYEKMNVMDCMTAPNGNKPGLLLWNRVCMISTLKLQVLYVDGAINSNCRVARNLYHASLMAAYRFHALITQLLWTRSKKQTLLNVSFLCRVVESCARKTCSALGNIRRRWEARVPLKNAEAKWLSYEAFLRKLRKHRGRYAKLLEEISALQREVQIHLESHRLAKLKTWIGRRLPLSFRRMK